MSVKPIHACQCEVCQSLEAHPDKAHHHNMNVLLSRLDEQQRRWYVGLEAERIGHGGTELLRQITGINVNTIRRGRREMAEDLEDRPTDRVRKPGGGRKPVEKNARHRSRTPGSSQGRRGRLADKLIEMGETQSAQSGGSAWSTGLQHRSNHRQTPSEAIGLWSGRQP